MARSLTSSAARGYGSAWRRTRLVVLRRDRWICQHCGAPATEGDHLGAKVNDPDSCVASCKRCNARRGGQKGAAMRGVRPSRKW